jgi:hypothetical protein
MALTRPRYSQIPDSDYKNSCRIVTTTDVTLTGSAPLTYDGVTLIQYDRVLVAGQTNKTQNGIYSVSTLGSGSNGTWVRSKDANANDRLTAGMNTFVEEGTYSGQFWHLLTPGPIVLGVTELIFGQITGNAAGTSSQVQYNLNGSIAGAANLKYDSVTGNVLVGGGTASTSNVTGALTVNGGIGITGNIWAQGNIYSAGSRVLTAYDLQTVTFTANYISKDPANVSVPVVGTGTIYGTHNFGNLEAISTYGDYDTVAQSGYYSVNDASGAPGFIVYVGFTGITSFNRAVFNINYTQLSGHTITLDFYNYDTDAWDPFATYSGLGNWQSFTLGVIDANPYIDAAGNVTTRVYHVSNGNTSHRTWIDYVALEQSITGGQGPRGATGATGPSGTYTGGYISGVIVTGGNITTSGNFVSNSGNISISSTTGALVLTGDGGAGIGGNIFAGGNVTASAFYTVNGLFWSGNGLAFSSGLEVSEINAANTLSNISSQVTSLRFDKDTGFSVTELDPGNVKISLGSSFKTWHVPGQADLVAAAEDEVTFFGNGIDITTNPTFPKAITFIANNSILEANIGAFYTYANANIGTLFLGNASTQANIGAYQIFANANAATQATSINTINANLGAFQTFSNANAAAQATSINTINANLGAYQIFANANAASQQTQLNSITTSSNANVAAYLTTYTGNIAAGNITATGNINASYITTQGVNSGNISGVNYIYANNFVYSANGVSILAAHDANIGTLFLGNAITNANLGAYQTWANLELGFAFAEIGDLDTKFDINAASQATALDNINANIGAFYTYANSKIGTNNNSNLVIQSTEDSISALTGALVVKGGVGVGGNLYVTGNIYASNLTAISISTLSVVDPLLYLTADTPFPYNYDIGFFSHYSKVSGDERHTGLARDYTTDTWNFFSNIDANPGATVDWTEANLIYDTVRVGDFIVANTTTSTSTSSGALRVAGGAGVTGALYITNTGDVSANIGTLFLGNLSTQANLGEFQIYSNAAFATLDANIGTLFLGNAGTQANLGTLFLGNASTQANLGAFQTYTNTSFATLDANIGTLFLGNASTQANIGIISTTVDDLASILGSYAAYANVYLGVSKTFTVTNVTSSEYIIDGTGGNPALYLIRGQKYNFSINASSHVFWIKTAPSTGTGDQYSDGVVGNGTDNSTIVFDVPLAAPDVLYYSSEYDASMNGQLLIVDFGDIDANVDALYNSNISIQANLGTLFLGNLSTNANLGAFQTYANTTFTTYSNANVAAYLPIYSGNISAGNIDVTSNVFANKFYTTNGIYWSGNGASYSTGGGGGITYTAATTPPVGPAVGDQWYDTADGILYEYMDDGDTDQWVDIVSPTFSGANPVAFNSNVTVTGNIFIGDGIFWTVNGSPYSTGGGGGGPGEDSVLRANVGAYQIYANANIGTLHLGNISINSNLGAYQTWANSRIQVLDANLGTLFLGNAITNANLGAYQTWANATFGTSTYSNTNVAAYLASGIQSTGANISGDVNIVGNLTASLGFVLEKTNIVPSSPATVSDIDILTCPIVFFTSNATSNIAVNLRGNSTTALNDIVANGQAVTFSMFMPQATAYYVNEIRIDNLSVPSGNVSWQGYTPVTSGNANSIDLYAFTAIKGSINNWRVFATQTTYTHSGLWSNYRTVQFAAEYIVVAGGGSGATSYGGGGGAGGLRYGSVPISGQQAYTVTVGGGGAATSVNSTNGSVGTNSTFSGPTFSTITAAGGGFGGRQGAVGGNGGSGGGGGSNGPGYAGGISTPVTAPVQGYGGGAGIAATPVRGAGGGGGAGGTGSNGSTVAGGNGGVGANYSTWATATSSGVGGFYAGGGGGGAISGTNVGGTGGSGGGGRGGSGNDNGGTAGSTNTGGGGGGMGDRPSSGSSGAGGSGIVLIRYADTYPAATSTTGSPTLYTIGGYRYYKFTGDGSITW